jgi:hypothetical protein
MNTTELNAAWEALAVSVRRIERQNNSENLCQGTARSGDVLVERSMATNHVPTTAPHRDLLGLVALSCFPVGGALKRGM